MADYTYVGGELDLFAHARNWKRYWTGTISGLIHGRVLEVGAGIGTNTVLLRSSTQESWLCLEPDPNLVERLQAQLASQPALPRCEVMTGAVTALDAKALFDTILYIDVLEHIGGDGAELQNAARHLSPGGILIVLSPAHQKLFSEFDRAIGHFRRYTTGMLSKLTPETLVLQKAYYLDSVGLFASAANRMFLRQSMPTPGQIKLWDTFMVPCSRLLDPLTGNRFGKSVIAIWRKSK